MSARTTSIVRRAAESIGMATLLTAARLAVQRGNVQVTLARSDRLAGTMIWWRPFVERDDTLARGRALAYRWSRVVPDATCLHRALATRVWLAGFGIESRIVVGFRREEALAGHAWLEVDLGDAATVLFHEEPDEYVVAMVG